MCPEELFTDLISAINDNDTLKKSLRVLSDENQHLKDRIAWFERQIFGQKIERFTHNEHRKNYPLMFPKQTLKSKPKRSPMIELLQSKRQPRKRLMVFRHTCAVSTRRLSQHLTLLAM
jgi:hypothetical protein